MKNTGERLKEALLFLEERKGYRYHLSLSVKKNIWTCSIVGESLFDKSYPHDFCSCSVEDFDKIPDLIKLKAIELLNKEVEKNKEAISDLIKTNEKLQAEYNLVKQLSI